MRFATVSLGLALLLGGCGTIGDLAANQRITGGVWTDCNLIDNLYLPNARPPEYSFPLVTLGLLDQPFSAVLDTLVLSMTIPITLSAEDKPDR
ncbi:MAG TPA: hypothetical protein VE981_14415 [Planctomycetota bacterium]|nr:hypothetical protein [Planctomycetota bacterium]